jgi:hypothetical protein
MLAQRSLPAHRRGVADKRCASNRPILHTFEAASLRAGSGQRSPPPPGRPPAGTAAWLRVTSPDGAAALIDRLRADGVVLTHDPGDRTLRASVGIV